MWICPICSAQNADNSQRCDCGFDNTINLTHYPTLVCPDATSIEKICTILSATDHLRCLDCGGIAFRFRRLPKGRGLEPICCRCGRTQSELDKLLGSAEVQIARSAPKSMLKRKDQSTPRNTSKQNAQSTPKGTLSKQKLKQKLMKYDIRQLRLLNTLSAAKSDAKDISKEGNWSVLGWKANDGAFCIAAEGAIVAPPDCSELFAGLEHLEAISGAQYLDTSHVRNMSRMFAQCRSLTLLDVSKWDTSRVTIMRCLFMDCHSLTLLDVSRWNTSQVTDMSWMFSTCSSLTVLDVSRWDTSQVTNMSWMFYYCHSLRHMDAFRWQTGRVNNRSALFEGVDIQSKPGIRPPSFAEHLWFEFPYFFNKPKSSE